MISGPNFTLSFVISSISINIHSFLVVSLSSSERNKSLIILIIKSLFKLLKSSICKLPLIWQFLWKDKVVLFQFIWMYLKYTSKLSTCQSFNTTNLEFVFMTYEYLLSERCSRILISPKKTAALVNWVILKTLSFSIGGLYCIFFTKRLIFQLEIKEFLVLFL